MLISCCKFEKVSQFSELFVSIASSPLGVTDVQLVTKVSITVYNTIVAQLLPAR